MKKIISLLLAVFLILGCVPVAMTEALEEIPPVNYLLSDCDTTSGWATEASLGSLALSSDAAVGSGSVKVTCSKEMYFFFISQMGALDFTHVTHFDFWFYTSDPDIFSYGDCGFNLSYTSAWANNGVAVKASSFKALSLETGWNHISVPLDFSEYSESFDIENIGRFRFYAVGLPTDATFTVAVDEVRAVNAAGVEQIDQLAAQGAIDKIDAIGTVNTYSRLAISDARSAYNALTDTQKALVTNYDKLTAAETTFSSMGTPTETTYTTLSNCDTMTGWEARNSVNTEKKTEGTGSIQQSITTQMMYYFNNTSGFDFTDATHMEFDLYVEDTSFFAHGDCGMNLSSVGTGAWWGEEGIRVTAKSLKDLTLNVGWNHIKVPLVFVDSPAASFNKAKVTNIRFYAVGFTSDTTVLIDDFKMVKEASGDSVVTIPDDMKNKKPDLSTESEAWVLSSCNATGGITVSSCENKFVVTAESDTFTAFTALSAGTVEVKAPGLSSSPVSITGYAQNDLALRFQFYISNAAAIKSGQVEITSGGKPDTNETNWTMSQLNLKNGWNVVYLDFADAGSTGGTLSLTGINYMRIYMFLNSDAVMAYDDIKIVKRSVVSVSENFSTAESLGKWNSNTADVTREKEQLCISGDGEVSVSSIQYPLNIVHPDRTPIEFELYAKNPTGVLWLSLTLTDSKGRTATVVLDTDKLSAYTVTRYQIIPSEMVLQDKFNSETITKITLSATLEEAAVIMDNFEVNVRNGQYWRDWVYNYKSTLGDYSIAVIPDIQELTAVYPQKLNTIMQWLVDNKETENLEFVIDVGDVTWNGHTGNTAEFQTAANAFKKLQDAGIDYSIAYGNHDYTHGSPRNTDLLNQYFPVSNLSTFPSYGGVMTEGKMDNMYYCFNVQGNKYMVVSLEFDPTDETIAWANEVVAAHPDYQVIITTHNYMNSVYGQYSYTGQNLWPNLVSKHENIIMVICGHDFLTADPGSLSYRVDKGEKGNTVHQLMVNSQDIDASRGGVGLLLMMRFTNGGKKVDLNYFSPVNNNLAYKSQNQFTLQVGDFTSNTDVETPIYHLGLSTADDTDDHWSDYRYVAQEFVPAVSSLYGAKVALNLTNGKATVHAEIRKEVNGEPLYSTDVEITSKGDGVNWYDIDFGTNMNVTPGEAYYLVYYLTARDENSVCVVHGLVGGKDSAPNPGYVWQMASGGDVTFNSDNNRFTFGFELVTEPYVVYGDTDGDGDISSVDALLALQHSVGKTALKDRAFTAADVTAEYGTVTSSDALCILQYAVEIINSFDVQNKQ